MMQNTPSMISNLPDAIKCGVDTHQGSVLILHGENIGSTAFYFQVYHQERFIRFNLDGTYHSRAGTDDVTKGCQGKSLQQLYTEGRAFNIVNDPKQKEEIQELIEKSQKQGQKIEELEEENNLLKKHIKKSDSRIERLEENFKTLQQSMPKEITSDDCFGIFKQHNIEMCISAYTKITSLEPPFVIAKSNICMDEDIFDICKQKFEEKGIVICGEIPEYKMFE